MFRAFLIMLALGVSIIAADATPPPGVTNKNDDAGRPDVASSADKSRPLRHPVSYDECLAKGIPVITRLGIPCEFTNEGLRGVETAASTGFPCLLAQSCTRDRELVRAIASVGGVEIQQLYFHQRVSSLTVFERQLRGFDRIELAPGEAKTVTIPVDAAEALWMLDKDMKRVVEPGVFDILIGASSLDIRLKGILNVR